jgi:L-lactate dehydrogenase complex protein LldF
MTAWLTRSTRIEIEMTPAAFHDRIKQSIQNPTLQAALDANAERRLAGRLAALGSLSEDLQTLRRRAHDLRSRTIADLDRYLEQFCERVQANGMIVHHAADANQAGQIVLEIARQHNARLIAKSKTMVSEEIELNHVLQAAGLKVVETDLGEFIVQIREEPPSHIITPAVHLVRADVGRTFHEKLGVPFTTDIPEMTSVARKVLRETFLQADIGISGVNFGIAESGTLCIVTNEGNGRMVTTLPPVHIALMGIERLLPRLEDLATLLALLPRYATGQKISVYTSLIHSPRRADDLDGPAERHLVLVDNGRRMMRHSPLSEALLCIRCGSCLNACPVFRELGGHAYVSRTGKHSSYPGPIGSVISPALFGQLEFGQLARASSLCGACKEACPVDIDLPKLLLRVRAGGVELDPQRATANIPGSLKLGLRGFGWIATRPRLFGLAERLAGVMSRLLPPFSGWLRFPALTGWGYSKDFPQPAAKPFRDRWAKRSPDTHLPGIQSQPGETVDPGEQEETLPTLGSADLSDLQERFTSELQALNGKVSSVSIANLTGEILKLLSEHQTLSLIAWDAAFLPSGLVEGLKQAGIKVTSQADPNAQAGLSGSFGAIAETGTLILAGGQGRTQMASLLPPFHIALLDRNKIYATLAEVTRLPEIRGYPNLVLVSGPSRTADIEMTLTIGVHGPGELHVLIFE